MNQKAINRMGQREIQGWANTVRVLWQKACQEDGIEPEASFVVFSDGNKFADLYNRAILHLQEAEAAYAAGGYVGLMIKDGKARP